MIYNPLEWCTFTHNLSKDQARGERAEGIGGYSETVIHDTIRVSSHHLSS